METCLQESQMKIELIRELYVDQRLSARRVFEELKRRGYDDSMRTVQRTVKRLGIVRPLKEAIACTQIIKECKTCGEPKSMFPTQHYCDTCRPNIDDLGLIKTFGITRPELDTLLERQGNACGICGRTFAGLKSSQIHIDHCHKTKHVRGVLCVTCNRSLSALDEDEWLEKAQRYLTHPGIASRSFSKVARS